MFGLLVGLGLVVVLAIFMDPVIIGFGLFLLPPIAFEWWMIRRTGERTKIPDFRPPETVEIELDPD